MAQTSGRPRAQGVEDRLTAAAVEMYGRLGWEGLSIAGAAQQAGLGKSSAYLRWRSKADLLAAALDRHGAHVQDVDTGSIRSDLVALGMAVHGVLDGPAGAANLRLLVEARHVPELDLVHTKMLQGQIGAARHIVRRGIDRGEVPASTSIGLILNAVCGGVLNQILTAPDPAHGSDSSQQVLGSCERLVDVVLAGIRSGP